MKKIFVLLTFLGILIACSKTENGTIEPDNFDKTALLTNWAENIIVPSYVNYQNKVTILNSDIVNFNSNPTILNIQTVRNSWLEAYKSYQYVSQFNFGKAEDISFKEATNTYPTDATGIDANILSGTYNFNAQNQFTKQGFPALDYLLNGLALTDASIITFYTLNANANNYKKYLTDVAVRLKTNADAIVTDWNSGYKNTYISNTGTTVSGSINRTTNNFVKNIEKDIRTGKLGIPAGLFSDGATAPKKLEAFYKKDVSKILLTESLKASQDFFNGKYFNSTANGPSLKSYLEFLNIVRNNQKLSDIINNQFNFTFTSINTLNNNFLNQISTDNSKMLLTFDVLQQNVIYTKVDMMQALNIAIDYVDGDGD